jgi:transposase InsO family protein
MTDITAKTGKVSSGSDRALSNIIESIGVLDDMIPWKFWKAKFIRSCKLFGYPVDIAENYGFINLILEKVVSRSSSAYPVIESQMLRENDDKCLISIIDEYFKLIDNPLSKINKLKMLEFQSSNMNLIDFTNLTVSLCKDVGVSNEADQVLWVLSSVGENVLARLPENILSVKSIDDLISMLSNVMKKFDLSLKDNEKNISYIKKEKIKKCKNCSCDISGQKFNYCDKCYKEWSSKQKVKKKNSKNNAIEEDSVSSIIGNFSYSISNDSSFLSFNQSVCGKDLKVMWDTGATGSFGVTDLPYKSYKKSKSIINYANGSREISENKGLIDIIINGKPINIWLQIVKKLPSPVIIGMNIMRNNVTLDLVNNNIIFNENFNHDHINYLSDIDDINDVNYPCLIGTSGRLRDLIIKWISKFKNLVPSGWSTTPEDLDIFDVKLKDTLPVYQNPTKFYGDDVNVVENIVKKWFKAGIIRRSKSKYASRMLLVKKTLPDGTTKHRLVPHFVEINEKIFSENYPLPIPRDCAERINGKFKSVIDIDSAYLHCRSTDLASETLAFTVSHIFGLGSHFEFANVMPWSTKNAGRHLQRLVENLGKFDYTANGKKYTRNMLHEIMEVFQDDICCHENDVDKHINDLDELFQRMFDSGFPPNWAKCVFAQEEVKWCGLVISKDGIKQDPDKVSALSKLKSPSSWKELESLIGKMNWHRSHVFKYAEITKPIYDFNATRTRRKFNWTADCRRSFMKFIVEIKKDVVLRRLKPEGQIYVNVDMSSSNRTLSAVLIQVQEDKEVILGYASKKLGDKEIHYGAPKLEFMAIWFGLIYFENEVRGRNAIVRSDHKSLTDLHFKVPKGIWITWLLDVMSFDAKIIHISGKDNVLADALSRLTDWSSNVNSMIIDDMNFRKRIIRRYHHHLSVGKTIKNVRQKYDWDTLPKDVQEFTDNCYYCLRNRIGGELRNKMTSSVLPGKLWEILCIDVIPMLELKNGEKKHIGIAVDVLSNMSFMFPLNTLYASEFIKKLKSKVIDYCGPPKSIIGDKAKQFLSSDFESLLKDNGILYSHSAADHHQGNAQVENRIKTLKKLLHSFLDEGLSLRNSIKETLHASNNIMVNDSRGFTPYHIVNGHVYEDGFDRLIKSDMEARSYVREVSLRNLDNARIKQKAYYDVGKKDRKYMENDWVMVVNKLKVKWNQDDLVGPYRIEKVLPNDNYLIHNHFKSNWNVYNIQQIGNKVDVYDSRFGYKFDNDSQKWVVSDTQKVTTGNSVLNDMPDITNNAQILSRLMQASNSSNKSDLPLINNYPLKNNELISTDFIDSKVKNAPNLNDRIKVHFQSNTGKSGYDIDGKVIGIKDNNEFLVQWDKMKKPETVNLSPQDLNSNNSDRWSFL